MVISMLITLNIRRKSEGGKRRVVNSTLLAPGKLITTRTLFYRHDSACIRFMIYILRFTFQPFCHINNKAYLCASLRERELLINRVSDPQTINYGN
jgi:hypothetical protein